MESLNPKELSLHCSNHEDRGLLTSRAQGLNKGHQKRGLLFFNRFTLGTSAPKWPALLSGIKLGAGAGRGVEKSHLIPQLSATAHLQVLLASCLDHNNGA